MTLPFYKTTWVDATNVDKADIRGGFAAYVPLFLSVSELRAMDAAGHALAVIVSSNVARVYEYDDADTTSADDGDAVLVSNDGGRYKYRAALSAAQVAALYASVVGQVSAPEIEAGDETDLRTYAPADIVALAVEHARPAQVSSPERTAGTETALRSFSPADVAAMAAAHGGGGGGAGGVNPNLIINGDFQINQRGFGGGVLAVNAYGFDRWYGAAGSVNVSVSGYVVTLSSGTIGQKIEMANWGYSISTGLTFTVSVDTPSADLTVNVNGTTGTITAGAGRRSVTITPASGSTTPYVTIAKASAGSVTFGRVKVEIGSTATDWQARPRVVEAALCARYYQTSYPAGTAPGAADTTGLKFHYVDANTTAGFYAQVYFPDLMRAAPTVTVYDRLGAANKISKGATDGITAAVFSINAAGFLGGSGTTATAATYVAFNYAADAEL